MDLKGVGQVIATRHIRKDGQNAYVVRIGLPQPFPDSTDFYCPVQILTVSEDNIGIGYSAGIDSMQALQLAMRYIGSMLLRLNEQCGGRLRWVGDENGDLGFPLPI